MRSPILRILFILSLLVALGADAKDYVRTRQVRSSPQRSTHQRNMFLKLSGYPHGRPGHQIDHILPIKRGGLDVWWNMQWLAEPAKYLKDRWE